MNLVRPHVHINVAMTSDGKIDTIARNGARISSPADIQRVDRLRAEMDAVLVGGKTLINEDPRLTVKAPELRLERLSRGMAENPAKIGIVTQADIKIDSRFMTEGAARRIICTTRRTSSEKISDLQSAGAEVYLLGEKRVNLEEALSSLYQLGIGKLMVEGGGTIIAEFLRLGLVDEITIYIAPFIFGGVDAPSLADGPGFLQDQAPQLDLISANRFDEQGGILIHYKIRR